MTALNVRTMKLGQLEELKQKEYRLRVQIDTCVKAVINGFEPMDLGMSYIDAIEPKRLEIQMHDIRKKCHELSGVIQERKALELEVNGG